MLVNYYLKV